jgi:hypothetical protein
MKRAPVKPVPLILMAGAAAYLLASKNAQAALPSSSTDVSPSTIIGGFSVQGWSQDVDTLARTIWGEARGDGWNGMQAVANVVMNRLSVANAYADGYWWGNSVQQICTMRSGNTYQFDVWNPSDPNYSQIIAVTPADPDFANALQIATMALAGTLGDITNGATNYYAPAGVLAAPYWTAGLQPVATIGGQLFYQVG